MNDSWNQFRLGLGDVALNVVAPTLATAGGGALMAASMSNVESLAAATSLGVNSVVQGVAEPLLQNHLNKKQETTKKTTQNWHEPRENPVFTCFKKVMVKY